MEKEQLHDDLIFVIHQFLAAQECAQLIALAEQRGFEEVPVASGDQPGFYKEMRTSLRVVLEDLELAARLWEMARPFVPETWFQRKAVGLNERFRLYRHDPGERFAAHMDGSIQRDNGTCSLFTFMVYLNDDFEGGNTTFFVSKPSRGNGPTAPGKSVLLPRPAPKPRISVAPRTGMALVFAHRMLHEGEAVVSGRKYVLRTDVMYQ